MRKAGFLIRDTFKRGKYQDVILPLTVLRRLDCVLEHSKEQVLFVYGRYKSKLDNPLLISNTHVKYYFGGLQDRYACSSSSCRMVDSPRLAVG